MFLVFILKTGPNKEKLFLQLLNLARNREQKKRFWCVEMEIEFPYVEEESSVLETVKRPRINRGALS